MTNHGLSYGLHTPLKDRQINTGWILSLVQHCTGGRGEGEGEGGGRGRVRGGWTGEMGSLEIQASVGGGEAGGSRPSSLNKISHPKARNILHHVGYDNHVNRRLLSW